MTDASHVPVLLDRVVALVAPALTRPDRERTLLVDATLGLGGHTEAVLERCPQAHVIGVDRDVHALDRSRTRLAPYGERVTFVHAVYDEIGEVLADLGHPSVDGVLFDLGVSSMQLDLRERGFAYAEDAPLDMRMDDTDGPTAADVLNDYPVEELTRILQQYGEEKFARRIAQAVVRERAKEPFTRSGRLVELLYAAIPAPARRTGGHPAKRTFQALRIEVNDELSVLRRALAGGHRGDRCRWAGGRHELPLARGPDHQAGLHRAHPQPRAAGHAGRAGGPRAAVAAGHARVGEGHAGRDRGQPAGRLGAAASGRAGARGSSGMTGVESWGGEPR